MSFPVFFVLFLLLPSPSASAEWNPLIQRLISDNVDEQTVRELFARPEVLFDSGCMARKVKGLIKRKFDYRVHLLSRPPHVYKDFVKPEMITMAATYFREHEGVLMQVQEKFCVPAEIVVSIFLVETRLGEYLGERNAFSTLASMAASGDLETVRDQLAPDLTSSKREAFAAMKCRLKAEWAYMELKALITYAEENDLDPVTLPGSIYGAIGLCQFMPSQIPKYGFDADDDGRIDLFTSPDALYSIGNYLQAHGWKCRMSRAGQFKVLRRYNNSYTYANTVLTVAAMIKERHAAAGEEDKASG